MMMLKSSKRLSLLRLVFVLTLQNKLKKKYSLETRLDKREH